MEQGLISRVIKIAPSSICLIQPPFLTTHHRNRTRLVMNTLCFSRPLRKGPVSSEYFRQEKDTLFHYTFTKRPNA